MITVDILDSNGQVMGHMSFEDGTPDHVIEEKLALYTYVKPPKTPEQIVAEKLSAASKFGTQIINDFAAENVVMGIVQADKVVEVTDYLHKLSHYITTGSLYAAIDEIDYIIADQNKSHLEPFITNERLDAYKVRIKKFLSI